MKITISYLRILITDIHLQMRCKTLPYKLSHKSLKVRLKKNHLEYQLINIMALWMCLISHFRGTKHKKRYFNNSNS